MTTIDLTLQNHGEVQTPSIEATVERQIYWMFEELEKQDRLFAPSLFWKKLCDQHCELVRRYGFASFKRTVNFNYGQWGVGSFRDQFLSHVLKQLLQSGRIPYVPFLSRMSNIENIHWPSKQPFSPSAYKFLVGMLWQLAWSRDDLGCLKACEESLVGGPIDIKFRRRLISQDLAQSSLELNSIMSVIGSNHIKAVGEIGGGCGRFSYLFMSMYPDAHYSIFDIPPALAISQNHLAMSLGPDRVSPCDKGLPKEFEKSKDYSGTVSCYLPHALVSIPDRYFDLFINVSSFDEMLPEQIECYFDLIERKCSGWLYVKGFSSVSGINPAKPGGLANFPYRPHWQLVYEAQDAIMPLFSERIYDLRG